MAATTLHSLPQGAVPSTWFAPTFGAPSLKRPAAFKPDFSLGDDSNKLYTAPQSKRLKVTVSSKVPIPFTPKLPRRADVALRPAATNGMYHQPSPEAVAAYGDQLETETRTIGYDVQPRLENLDNQFGVPDYAAQAASAEMAAHFKSIEDAVKSSSAEIVSTLNDGFTKLDTDLIDIADTSNEIAANTANTALELDAVNKNIGNLTDAILHPPQPELNDADKAGGFLSGLSKITGTIAGFASFIPGVGTAVALGLGAVSLAAGAGAAISKSVAVKQRGGSDLAATGTFFGEAAQTVGNVAQAAGNVASAKARSIAARESKRENMSNAQSRARAAAGMESGTPIGGNGGGGSPPGGNAGGGPTGGSPTSGSPLSQNAQAPIAAFQGSGGQRAGAAARTAATERAAAGAGGIVPPAGDSSYTPSVIDRIMSTPLPGTGPAATPPRVQLPPQYTPGAGVRPRAGSGGSASSGGGLMQAFNAVATPTPSPRTGIRNYLSTFPTSPYVSRLGSLGTLKGFRNMQTKQTIKNMVRGGSFSTMPPKTPRGRYRTTRPGDQFVADVSPTGGFMF